MIKTVDKISETKRSLTYVVYYLEQAVHLKNMCLVMMRGRFTVHTGRGWVVGYEGAEVKC